MARTGKKTPALPSVRRRATLAPAPRAGKGWGSLFGHLVGLLVALGLLAGGWLILAGQEIVAPPALLAEYPENFPDFLSPGPEALTQARVKQQAWRQAVRLGLQATLSLSEPEIYQLLAQGAPVPERLTVQDDRVYCGVRSRWHGLPVCVAAVLAVESGGGSLVLQRLFLGRLPLPAFLGRWLPMNPADILNRRLDQLFPVGRGRYYSLHPGELVISARKKG